MFAVLTSSFTFASPALISLPQRWYLFTLSGYLVTGCRSVLGVSLVLSELDGGRPAWHSRSACRGSGIEMFPERVDAQYGDARALCSVCPVIEPCRVESDRFEVRDDEVFGMRAGETPDERTVRRSARRSAVA